MNHNNDAKNVIGIIIAVLSGIALVAEAIQDYEDSKGSDEN